MRRHSEREGFTLIEIMIVVAIIALLAAIAIPNVLRGRTTANESAAIGNLRALVSSLEMERSVNNIYPDTTATDWTAAMYGTACGGPAGDPVAPDFGPPSFCTVPALGLTNFVVQGFAYTYTNGPTAGQTYNLVVDPTTPGTTGSRAFYASETGLVLHCRRLAAAPTAAAARVPAAGWVTIDVALPVGADCS